MEVVYGFLGWCVICAIIKIVDDYLKIKKDLKDLKIDTTYYVNKIERQIGSLTKEIEKNER